MALSSQEQLALMAALNEIKLERKNALKKMFQGTKLVRKSLVQDAKDMCKSAKDAKKKFDGVPGMNVPNLELGIPPLNIGIFQGINLKNLINFDLKLALGVPNIDLIPDISIGGFPGFNLPKVRLNLKGILKYKDLFPNISLRALVWAISVKYPHLNLPSIVIDIGKILEIEFPDLIKKLEIQFPEFFEIDLEVSLPNLKLPDVNLPNVVPQISLDVPKINLGELDIPGIDLPRLLKIPGFSKVMKLLLELFDVGDLPDIIGDLGLDFLQDFVSSALPLVQQVKSGAKAASSWGRAAQDLHKSFKTKKHMPFVLPGNARDAVIAVRTLLRQSSAEHAARATIETTQFAVSTAGLFADLGGATGPATSAAASLAKLCQKITIFAFEYKQMKKVNHILKTSPDDALSSELFNVSPLLGCYYLANNTTSNVLNVLSDNIIEDDWMADAENNKRKHLDPLIKESQKFIEKSRYVLQPIKQDKGMYVELSSFEKLKARFALSVKKKLHLAPSTAKVKTHRYIG